jgi:tetratricopeptide (TPR) repeat protein
MGDWHGPRALLVLTALVGQCCLPARAAAEPEVSPFSTGGSVGSTTAPRSFEDLPIDTDAEGIYADVLEKLDPMMAGHAHFIEALERLAYELENKNYFEQAEKLLKRAEKLTRSEYLQVETLKFKIQIDLAYLSLMQKKFKEAVAYARKAREDSDHSWEPSYHNPQPHVDTFQVLAETLINVDRPAEALPVLDEGLAFIAKYKKLFSAKQYALNKIELDTLKAESLTKMGEIKPASRAWLRLINETEDLYGENVGFADLTVEKYLKFMRANNQLEKADRFDKTYATHRLYLMRHKHLNPAYQSLRIWKEREEEEKAKRKNPKPQRSVDPTKKKEANAGSLS